ncbi:MAG: hypothetical protein EPO58_16040 [Chitinophagaceae bacterium]|nr:MAG: hypothetical protein EPO58_16040 [Chitinophagaceae bacterium]
MQTKESIAGRLFDQFKHKYADKYSFPSDLPAGEGAHASVFKANDILRDTMVAIKIFHEGTVPSGSSRAWKLTSNIIHNQIAPTHTVETFVADGSEYKAVISRFIPGVTLKQVFDWWELQDEGDKMLIADDFSKTFLPSLINALEVCHSHKFGHGDLHEGNIMTFLTDIGINFTFFAVLIDFDAASVRTAVYEPSEEVKIASDIRLFNKRLGPYITNEWKWGKYLSLMYESYHSMENIKFAYGVILNFIDHVEKDELSGEFINAQIKQLVLRALSGFPTAPIMSIFRSIATDTGHLPALEKSIEEVNESIYNGGLVSSASMTEVNDRRNYLYKTIFP